MSNEERKQYIADMVRRIDDEELLRRIYLILAVMTGADKWVSPLFYAQTLFHKLFYMF